MSYIGNTSTTQAFTPAVDFFSGTGSATAFTLSRPVASVAQVQVTIDNVAQNPSSAYTISANTITFTSAPLSGTNNIYVYYTSPITQVIAPGQGTVTATSMASSTGTGAGVFQTSPTLVTPALGTPSALVLTNATGLPQAGLGTNVAGNGPAFGAYQSTTQTLSTSTFTKILFQTEEWDTNNNFASSTFTPTVAGYYQVCTGVAQIASYTNVAVALYKNGIAYKFLYNGLNSNSSGGFGSAMVYLNGSTDYIEIYASFSTGQGTVNAQKDTYFQAAMVRSA